MACRIFAARYRISEKAGCSAVPLFYCASYSIESSCHCNISLKTFFQKIPCNCCNCCNFLLFKSFIYILWGPLSKQVLRIGIRINFAGSEPYRYVISMFLKVSCRWSQKKILKEKSKFVGPEQNLQNGRVGSALSKVVFAVLENASICVGRWTKLCCSDELPLLQHLIFQFFLSVFWFF